MTAADIIALLGLEQHPEGGFYRRTYRHAGGPENRGHASAIYYLIEGRAFSLWHTLDADEMWHWYAGAPLELEMADTAGKVTLHTLGTELTAGQRPQILVPGEVWQRARSLGAWTLCGCTVAPGFDFATFRMIEGDLPPGAAG